MPQSHPLKAARKTVRRFTNIVFFSSVPVGKTELNHVSVGAGTKNYSVRGAPWSRIEEMCLTLRIGLLESLGNVEKIIRLSNTTRHTDGVW